MQCGSITHHLWPAVGEAHSDAPDAEWLPYGDVLETRQRTWACHGWLRQSYLLLGLWWGAASCPNSIPLQGHRLKDQSIRQIHGLWHRNKWSLCLSVTGTESVYILRQRFGTFSACPETAMEPRWTPNHNCVSWLLHFSMELFRSTATGRPMRERAKARRGRERKTDSWRKINCVSAACNL